MRRFFLSCVLLLCATSSAAQAEKPNAILLVAKPNLVDPNFSETVVLVTQARDFSTVGGILNRPTSQKLAALMPRLPGAASHAEPGYSRGPGMGRGGVALFRPEAEPKAAAFHVLRGVYLSMHPANVEPLLGAGE